MPVMPDLLRTSSSTRATHSRTTCDRVGSTPTCSARVFDMAATVSEIDAVLGAASLDVALLARRQAAVELACPLVLAQRAGRRGRDAQHAHVARLGGQDRTRAL